MSLLSVKNFENILTDNLFVIRIEGQLNQSKLFSINWSQKPQIVI